jgi:hypothetical protein
MYSFKFTIFYNESSAQDVITKPRLRHDGAHAHWNATTKEDQQYSEQDSEYIFAKYFAYKNRNRGSL